MARGDWIFTLALISGFGERVSGIDGRVIDEYTLNFYSRGFRISGNSYMFVLWLRLWFI